jgi:RNA polymerase sigma-70 factor (ECF subfamily)
MVLTFETFDEEYVRLLRTGDSRAGNHFGDYFGSLLYLKLRPRLRSAHLIEDVKQETLLRVLLILHRENGVKCPERFGAFVNGVCENVLKELCRSDRHDEPWDEHNMEEPFDPAIDLDADLINEESKRVISRIFIALPEKDRKILQAVFLDEIDRTEVCRMFKIDTGYLRVLVHRAKVHFRAAYEAADDFHPPFSPFDAYED